MNLMLARVDQIRQYAAWLIDENVLPNPQAATQNLSASGDLTPEKSNWSSVR